MSLLDEAIGLVSPGWKAARLKSRAMIRAYEAVTPTRTHRAKRENRNANQLTQSGGRSLREQARWLDCNHDLVIGLLDKLEERIVGARGIIVDPQPILKTGLVADELAKDIRAAWAEWSVAPDVTGQFTRPVLERLMARTWLRDGEVFGQMVSGAAAGLNPTGNVPFWIEALEPDFIPLELNDEGKGICQGVALNEWGRPTKYVVYKTLTRLGSAQGNTKEIAADSMVHLKFMRRLHQIRGNSLLAGVLMRLPTALETLANQTIKSVSVKGADINAGIINPIQNFATVISEARLDDKDAAAWYLAAAKGTDTIEVAYLNGVDVPYIDQQEGFNTDGIATKVRIDAGVAPLDHRGLVYSSGK